MKEAIVQPDLKVKIVDSEIPVPKDDEVVTKVVVSGSNPKDWKRPVMSNEAMNSGDDIAGVVHQVGRNVYEFKPGDRVAAFHQMMAPGGSFAEYAVSWAHTTFHIPNQTSFEEAASIPLAAMTAAIGLYQRFEGLPLPWHPTTKPIPLIVYGAASAVGAYAIKLAQLSNIHPLICIAGRGIPFVETLITPSKGDIILDYRSGDEKLVSDLKTAADKVPGGKIEYAFDAVSEHNSFQNICQVLDNRTGQITLVLPGKDYSAIPKSVTHTTTMVGAVHDAMDQQQFQKATGSKTGNTEFGYVMFRFFGRGLAEGWFRGHPTETRQGGLAGIGGALTGLKEGKASAVKYVFRLEETEGPGKLSTTLWHLGSPLLHTGLVITSLNREYAFGGHAQPSLTGVYYIPPGAEDPNLVTFRLSYLCGFSYLAPAELKKVVQDISGEFLGPSYNLLTRNCNHFSSRMCEVLTGRKAPGWINRAAGIGVCVPCFVPSEWIDMSLDDDDESGDGEVGNQREMEEERKKLLSRQQREHPPTLKNKILGSEDSITARRRASLGEVVRDEEGRVLPTSERTPLLLSTVE
ncbi:MAG: hypothetical protein Q9168_007379 [Polycauliona sp. 1 TL-2023]